MKRRHSLPVTVGNLTIGGNAPISVQTMSTVTPADEERAVSDVRRLASYGAEIVRFAVPDMAAAKGLKAVTAASPVPIVADIHFDYRLALEAVNSGVHALRINPGNIGADENVVKVVEKVRPRQIPIRIGINAGSLPEDLLKANGSHPTAEAMVEGALRHIRILERLDYRNMVISLKASDVPLMIEAYTALAEKVPYALHLGVTEAGLVREGSIKSAIGIGHLLYNGIGDTIRVSLTGDPAEEVAAGQTILTSLGLRTFGPTLISCPTCGRTQVDLIGLAQEVQEALSGITAPIKVAVMGCVVNGPGEAGDCDIGIAGAGEDCVIFKRGEIIKKIPSSQAEEVFVQEIERLIND